MPTTAGLPPPVGSPPDVLAPFEARAEPLVSLSALAGFPQVGGRTALSSLTASGDIYHALNVLCILLHHCRIRCRALSSIIDFLKVFVTFALSCCSTAPAAGRVGELLKGKRQRATLLCDVATMLSQRCFRSKVVIRPKAFLLITKSKELPERSVSCCVYPNDVDAS